MEIDLTTLKLDDILSKLQDIESNVCALTSSTTGGWQPTLAWNPVDVFEVAYDKKLNDIASIEQFVENQKKAGRLVIGYLSYDLGCMLHDVKLSAVDDLITPLVYILSFDNWITFHDDSSVVHAKDKLFEDEIQQIKIGSARQIPDQLYDRGLSSAWSRNEYNQAYKQVHDYIEAGDIYQVNLTHRLQGMTSTPGIDIFRKVSAASNSDFQSYIAGEDFEVISASPERFVRISNGQIETSPIKGTRARGADDEQDEALRLDLETNPKDRAELDMITDLMRNDLGMISEVGSVKVVERRMLKSYPTLWHAHSTVRSTLKRGISPIAALTSLMPGGSITGTPKRRAMEIIDELESKRRGIYTGSIFTIQPNGDLDSNIAIRTMIKKDKEIYLSVGGGIVYDSKQADEYQESLQKARAFLQI